MENESIVYWEGRPVGIDMGKFISWFPSATREAIKELSNVRK